MLAIVGVAAIVAIVAAMAARRLSGRRPTRMSDAWLGERALEDTKVGWDGPRWRLVSEVKAAQRADAWRARSRGAMADRRRDLATKTEGDQRRWRR